MRLEEREIDLKSSNLANSENSSLYNIESISYLPRCRS